MITVSNFAQIVHKELVELDLYGVFAHANGKHGKFAGRKYRRGKNRCKFCGATNNAADGMLEIPMIYSYKK
jgi:hypothetical protein